MQDNGAGGYGLSVASPEKSGGVVESQQQYMQQPGQGPHPGAAKTAPVCVQQAKQHAVKSPWHYSLCYCCGDTDSCCEACCCFYCQASRQCNFLTNNKKEIHYGYCCCMFFLDMCLTGLLTLFLTFEVRRLTRERYGIRGNACEDCCTAWCCPCCSTQQVLLEMTAMNDFPGATCYDTPSQPTSRQMT